MSEQGEEVVSGVYAIACKVNGRAYVGSSRDIYARWRQHRRDLRQGRCVNPQLQADWDEHGPSAFSYRVVEVTDCDEVELSDAEDRHIAQADAPYNAQGAHRARRRPAPVRPWDYLSIEQRQAIILTEFLPEARRRIGLSTPDEPDEGEQ